MSVFYVVRQKVNPKDLQAPRLYYAMPTSSGDILLKALGKKISVRCTVNHADTLAVLEALTQVLTEEISEGKIVRFGDFGSFQASFGSDGVEEEKEFHVSMIHGKKVIFRPGNDIKEMLNNLSFEKSKQG